MRQFVWRGIFGLLAGFGLVTLCGIGWGLATPGDLYANGSPRVGVSQIGSAVAGFALGYLGKARAFRVAVAVLAGVAVLFDLLVPSDWWVKPP